MSSHKAVKPPELDCADEVHALLLRYQLLSASPELTLILVGKVRGHRRAAQKRISLALPVATVAFPALNRVRIRAHAKALLRHASRPPKEVEATLRRRDKLLSLLDVGLLGVVTMAARSPTLDLSALVAALADGTEVNADLEKLIQVMDALPAPTRSGRPYASWHSLVHTCAAVWRAAGRKERFYQTELGAMKGPLIDFIRAVLSTAHLRQPTDLAIRDALLTEKK